MSEIFQLLLESEVDLLLIYSRADILHFFAASLALL